MPTRTMRLAVLVVPDEPLNDIGALTSLFLISTVTLPEPATLALFGLGLAGLGFARRKKVYLTQTQIRRRARVHRH